MADAKEKLLDEDLNGVSGGSKIPYTTESGDTYDSIIAKFKNFKISKEDIMKWNDLKEGDAIPVGATLNIYI
jgi:LysM repeat protein